MTYFAPLVKPAAISLAAIAGIGSLVLGPGALFDRVEVGLGQAERMAMEKTSTEDLIELQRKELEEKAQGIQKLKHRVFEEEDMVALTRAEIDSVKEDLAAEEDVLVHARLKLASTSDSLQVGTRQYSRADVENDVTARLERCEFLREKIMQAEEQLAIRKDALGELQSLASTQESELELAVQELETTRARVLNAEAASDFRKGIEQWTVVNRNGKTSAARRELTKRILQYERDLNRPERRPVIDWTDGPADLSTRLESYFARYSPSEPSRSDDVSVARNTK